MWGKNGPAAVFNLNFEHKVVVALFLDLWFEDWANFSVIACESDENVAQQNNYLLGMLHHGEQKVVFWETKIVM